MQKNYFLYLHPSDFLLADLYLEKLKKKEIVKKLDKKYTFL